MSETLDENRVLQDERDALERERDALKENVNSIYLDYDSVRDQIIARITAESGNAGDATISLDRIDWLPVRVWVQYEGPMIPPAGVSWGQKCLATLSGATETTATYTLRWEAV